MLKLNGDEGTTPL